VKKLLVVFIGLIGRILSELWALRVEQGSDGSAPRAGVLSCS
jgi:hypothetical protein